MYLDSLDEFLNTETRRKVFLYYVFSEISPSELVKEMNIPFSTVDRIINMLKISNFLLKSEKGGMLNYYHINWELWFEENLKIIGFDFIEVEKKKEIFEILKNKKFFALSYLLVKSDFAQKIFRQPLKLGDGLLILDLMGFSERKEVLSELPALILTSVVASPTFKKFGEIFDSDPDYLLKLFEQEIAKYQFIKKAVGAVDKEVIREYARNLSALSNLIERFFEHRLQRLSFKMTEAQAEENSTSKLTQEETV
jgi:hypothetical protein